MIIEKNNSYNEENKSTTTFYIIVMSKVEIFYMQDVIKSLLQGEGDFISRDQLDLLTQIINFKI